MDFGHQLINSYSNLCKPLCHELKISQTAFDILMFLANHPNYTTAGDVVRIRHIKANLVSMNVDKLVHEGYLNRILDCEDRRRTNLLLTEKAQEIIRKGKQLQQFFVQSLFKDIDEKELTIFFDVMKKIEGNLDEIKGGNMH